MSLLPGLARKHGTKEWIQPLSDMLAAPHDLHGPCALLSILVSKGAGCPTEGLAFDVLSELSATILMTGLQHESH